MKNPWRQYSKINPQREAGNRQIASDVFQALMSAQLSGSEFRIVFAVINKTWGYKKDSDLISISQFMEMTQLAERTVQESIKTLRDKRVIFYQPSSIRAHVGSPLNEFIFNKHYDTWNTQGCRKAHRVQKNVNKGAENCILGVRHSAPTKETITKETIQKKIYTSNSDEIRLSEHLLSLIFFRNPKFKKPNIQKWADHIGRLINIDKRTPEEIQGVIEWCQQDDFWQNNILSTQTLRKQFDKLFMKKNNHKGNNLHQKIINAGELWLRQTENAF
jgi:phage replication O-like protein O